MKMRTFIALFLGAATATTVQNGVLKKFTEYNQRACAWSRFQSGKDWVLFSRVSDDPAACAAGCLATKGCTGFEVSPRASAHYDGMKYCSLWLNNNCNDASKMLKLGGYKAKTYVLKTPTKEKTVEDLIEGIVETAQKKVKEVQNMDSLLKKKQESFEQAAKKQPLLLFTPLLQRACAWSRYTKGTDWSFASMKSDNKEECASACVAAKGCTGFEVGPHTSTAFNYISYCALWFNSKCNDEKNMLHLDPKGYVASTYVMVKSVSINVIGEQKTAIGTFKVEETRTFQPSVSKEHYNTVPKKQAEPKKPSKTTTTKHPVHKSKSKQAKVVATTMDSDTTTDSDSSVIRFDEFPQLACDFSQYKKGSDWMYSKTASDDAETCADTCLNTRGCTGFEIGIQATKGPYCALWESGSCSTKKSMNSVPVNSQTVATFVLADFHHNHHVSLDGFAVVFLIACACALVISVLLVGCICYKVARRVCCKRSELDCSPGKTPVVGELVQAKVIRGSLVGQRVDVVIVRGEAVDQK